MPWRLFHETPAGQPPFGVAKKYDARMRTPIRLSASLLALGLWAAPAFADVPATVELPLGTTQQIDVGPVTRFAAEDPDLVQAKLEGGKLTLTAQGTGNTRVRLWTDKGVKSISVHVEGLNPPPSEKPADAPEKPMGNDPLSGDPGPALPPVSPELAAIEQLIIAGKCEQAEPKLRAMLKKKGADPVAHIDLATCLTTSKHEKEATAELNAYLKIDPSGPRATLANQMLQMLQMMAGDTQAKPDGKPDATPDIPPAAAPGGAAKQADELLNQGDVSGAEALLRSELKKNAKDADLHRLLGDCMVAQGNVDEARKEMKRALELDPKGPHALQLKNALDGLGDETK
jgi:hypothetical protein